MRLSAEILKFWQPDASEDSPEQGKLSTPNALSAGLSALKIPGIASAVATCNLHFQALNFSRKEACGYHQSQDGSFIPKTVCAPQQEEREVAMPREVWMSGMTFGTMMRFLRQLT